MDIKTKSKEFLEKLRALPDGKKKVILWTIVAILALIMAYFWIKSTADAISKIDQGKINISLPNIGE